MHRPRIEGVQRVKKGGAVYYYHRATRTKLPGDYGSPEFMKALKEAIAKTTETATDGTLGAVVLRYKKSDEWRQLAQSTRDNYAVNLKGVVAKFGSLPAKFLGLMEFRRDVLRWRDEMAEKHARAANAKVTILSTVLTWAAERGEIPSNALKDISRTYKGDRAEVIWEPGDIAAFNKEASPALQKAVLMASDTGQRSGDLRALRWSAYDGKAIKLKQSKGGRWVYIPATKELKAMLDAEPRASEFILVNSLGNPWNADSFKRSFRAARKRAKLDRLHFHDLRGTCVTRLAEAGCTVPEIAAITGHSVTRCQKIIDVYMKRTDALSEAAIKKLDQHRSKSQRKGAKTNNPTAKKGPKT